MKNIMLFCLLFFCQIIYSSEVCAQEVHARIIDKIYFGSCSNQFKAMPILNAINKRNPDLFIMLGDNIYGDTEDMSELAAKYQTLAANPGFIQLKKQSDIIAIWDDHDFGADDAGKEYPQKEASRNLMLDFFEEPKESPRYYRDGIYTSYLYGSGEQTLQVILPDLRWNRDELHRVSQWEYLTDRVPKKMGPYKASPDENASMLGEKQWQWLEKELLKPARIKLIGSSLQLLSEFTGWESWANFPQDRKRLLGFINQHNIEGVMIISGDTHWGEVSQVVDGQLYPLWEVTSSGLSEEWKHVSPNKHRFGKFIDEVNYGFIEIDWQKHDPEIKFGLRNIKGETFSEHKLRLSSLSGY